MAEHKPIQNPEDYTEQDYDTFEMKLFSQFTSVEQLEEICMTLAHLPTKRAQELLDKFRKSERTHEVEWLECAVDEGQYLYLSPTNEEEERDYLALKVMQELEDRIIDLEYECTKIDLQLRKSHIRDDALRELVKNGEITEAEAMFSEDHYISMNNDLEELRQEIRIEEKTFAQIKKSIKTERYKNVNTMHMRHIHFDGE